VNWNRLKKCILKSLVEAEQMGWFTMHDNINMDGMAAGIANGITTEEQEKEKTDKISQMLEAVREYFPEKFHHFIKKEQP